MKKRTDNEIIELFWMRNENAILETEAKYGNYCFSVANNILVNREDAEECVSDTWLTAWNTIPPKRPKVLRLFLARITRRGAFDRYRRNTAGKRGGGEITQSLDELADCLPAPSSVEMELSAQEMKTCISAFLVTLPERDADVFLRRYFYVESVPEIAKRYALKESNVLMVLSRTRKKLEQHLIK
ncbi:MAG: sigma-70 family RNA polymerase sigma factor, partial [Lachnospiraceae bacterium]|nr:sigma-70 family RNA polymerase sigma factor [Lachnospiraceae bacterium]MBR0091220.1 sigma-70 family RNA polymerase sigma factor [Lachnospiraceae bacterium]